jgi:peptide/nickel transport system ATP-binding protein
MINVEELTKIFEVRKSLFSREIRLIRALDGVSFEIREGESFGLVGASGSGKTTCGKLLVRLLTPTSGKITFEGRDLGEMGRKEFSRKVQMIFQDPYESLNPRFTVFDAVSEPLIVQGWEAGEEVYRALETVGLEPSEYAHRFPHELSGGQRQRVSIARALVVRPRFLVADEPVSMLDVSIRAGILNLIRDLRSEKGLSLLFITHDLAVARYLCDRIAVLRRGRIVEVGPTEEIIHHPREEYTKALIASSPGR